MWKKITSLKSKTSPFVAAAASESGESIASSSSASSSAPTNQPRSILGSIFDPHPSITIATQSQPPPQQQHVHYQQQQVYDDNEDETIHEPRPRASQDTAASVEASAPGSPSSKRRILKRLSRQSMAPSPVPGDDERPSHKIFSLPKKVKSTISLMSNGSQASLSRASGDSARSSTPVMSRSASFDALRPPRASQDSVDGASRPHTPHYMTPTSAGPTQSTFDHNTFTPQNHQSTFTNRPPSDNSDDQVPASVRSILRGPGTPGTGQNVRFFNRDAFKVISPEQSMDVSMDGEGSDAQFQSPAGQSSQNAFFDRVQQVAPLRPSKSTGSVGGGGGNGSSKLKPALKKPRPSASEVFSMLKLEDDIHEESEADMSFPPSANRESVHADASFNSASDGDFLDGMSNGTGASGMFDFASADLPPLPRDLAMAMGGDGFSPGAGQTSTPYRSASSSNFNMTPSSNSMGSGGSTPSLHLTPNLTTTTGWNKTGNDTMFHSVTDANQRSPHPSEGTPGQTTFFSGIDPSTSREQRSPSNRDRATNPHTNSIASSMSVSSYATQQSSHSGRSQISQVSQVSQVSQLSEAESQQSQGSDSKDKDSKTSEKEKKKSSRSSTSLLLGRSSKPKYAVKQSKVNSSANSSAASAAGKSVTSTSTASTSSLRSLAKSRSRALSDTVFQTLIRSSSSSAESSLPPQTPPPENREDILEEAHEGDGVAGMPGGEDGEYPDGLNSAYTNGHGRSQSHSLVVLTGSPQASPGKADPFSAHATTYYTPGTPPRHRAISPSPLSSKKGSQQHLQQGHVRTASKDESLIFSLQTQLTLRTEICAQYEADLAARDLLVSSLTQRVSRAEEEDASRKGVLRKWKKRVGDLERMVRALEEEVDGSRQESLERSIMDEASGEALRMLHRRIGELEREKETVNARLAEREEERERMVKEAKEKEKVESSAPAAASTSDASELTGVKDGAVDTEAVAALRAEREQLNADLINLRTQHEDALSQLSKKDGEFTVLKQELEAQWGHTESASTRTSALTQQNQELTSNNTRLEEELAQLRAENEALVKEKENAVRKVDELEGKVADMENGWDETEVSRMRHESEAQELEALREVMEKERQELEEQLSQERAQISDLTTALQEREDRLDALDREHKFALDNIARLEKNLVELDEELNSAGVSSSAHQAEVESLREQISSLQRTHTHASAEQERQLSDAVGAQREAEERLKEAVTAQAEAETQVGVLGAESKTMAEEIESLRRQLRLLKTESADKEVKLVQAEKQRQQDREDKEGLNMALDSKQTELELMKRKLGLRGTAGATPASSKVAASRRESAAFATPATTMTTRTSRPPSVASSISSVTSKDPSSGGKKEPQSISASGRLPAMRTSTSSRSSMGPPVSRSSASISAGATPRAKAAASTAAAGSKQPVPRTSLGTPTPASAGGRPSSMVGLGRASQPSATALAGTRVSSAGRKPLVRVTRQPSVDEKENEGEDSEVATVMKKVAIPA